MSATAPTTDPRPRPDDLIATAEPSSTCDPATAEHSARQVRAWAVSNDDEVLEIEAGVWICIHLLRRGSLREAIAESRRVRDRLRGEPAGTRLGAARMQLLRTVALAASEASEFSIALDAAQELAADPTVQADATAAFDAAFSLAVCFERMGNNWEALRILREVIDQHGDRVPSYPLLYTLNAVVATAIGTYHRIHDIDDRGEVAELLCAARRAAERALGMLPEFGSPVYEVAVEGNYGEVLTYLGELDAAEPKLRNALAVAERIGVDAHRDRVRASIGAWLHLAGRDDEALAWLQQLIRDLGDDGPQSTLIRAHHAAYLAATALGHVDVALAHLEVHERLERRRTTSQLRSQSEMFVSRSEAQAEVARHRYSAERDPMTGLGNRRRLARALDQLLPRAAAEQLPFALAVLDVDHFKSVNDEFGHAAGDAVLVELARLLNDQARQSDVIVRHGGEEIVIVLPDTPVADAFEQCELVRARIAAHEWPGLPADRRITVSVGVAGAPPHDGEELLRAADRALYGAKRAGRNLVHLTPGTPGRRCAR